MCTLAHTRAAGHRDRLSRHCWLRAGLGAGRSRSVVPPALSRQPSPASGPLYFPAPQCCQPSQPRAPDSQQAARHRPAAGPRGQPDPACPVLGPVPGLWLRVFTPVSVRGGREGRGLCWGSRKGTGHRAGWARQPGRAGWAAGKLAEDPTKMSLHGFGDTQFLVSPSDTPTPVSFLSKACKRRGSGGGETVRPPPVASCLCSSEA